MKNTDSMPARFLEVPDHLVKLYRHWQDLDSNVDYCNSTNVVGIKTKQLEEIACFAKKRMWAWQNHEIGAAPTSDDPIIAKFKFCNIYRELDGQTIHFHTKLNPLRGNFNAWLLNMFAFRMIANIKTVDKLGLLQVGLENRDYLTKLKSMKRPKFGNAYIFPISTIQNSPWPSREEFLSLYPPLAIQQVADCIREQEDRTVNELLDLILPIFKFNLRFLWTEVLIDVHYQYPNLVNLNEDFHIGPGAKQSLMYLSLSEGLNSTLNTLASSYGTLDGVNLTIRGEPVALNAENWEGICCEFRKYQNLKSGKGRRRLYN